jgi:hypothetical protein
MATPFVQGRLRDEPLTFAVTTECACCGRAIRFRVTSDLRCELLDPSASPLFFNPLVDLLHLKAPSIIDDF